MLLPTDLLVQTLEEVPSPEESARSEHPLSRLTVQLPTTLDSGFSEQIVTEDYYLEYRGYLRAGQLYCTAAKNGN